MEDHESRCRREIVRLHDFFVDWFSGSVDKNDEEYERVTQALAEDFHLINPRGINTAQPALLKSLRGAYGCHPHQDNGPSFAIDIRNVECLHTRSTLLDKDSSTILSLWKYEEWQRINNKETARISTVMFQDDPSSPHNQLKWLHVHETWLPEGGPREKS